jgi:hypothetical protein
MAIVDNTSIASIINVHIKLFRLAGKGSTPGALKKAVAIPDGVYIYILRNPN